jgi:hypothetical protein
MVSKSYDLIPVSRGTVSQDYSQKVFATPFECNSIIELELSESIPEYLIGESHLAHDDYLRVIKGNLIALVVYNRQLHYIPLTFESNKLLHIPKLTWHTVVNISKDVCIYQNWMKVWKQPTKADYKPISIKTPFDLSLASLAQSTNQVQSIAL